MFPYQPNGMPTVIGTSGLTGKPSVEPCVLIREPSDWWGYFNTAELPTLLSSFSSEIICERVLILRLIEKMAYTRVQLYRSVLTIRSMQRDWIFRRFRTEHWVHNVKLPTEAVQVVQTNRLLELVWARCCEVRNQLHTSSLYKFEDDPPVMTSARTEKDNLLKKQKKYRDTITDETFEHHAQRGWNRFDALQRLRQTAASTTATRIIADPTINPNLTMVLKRSPFLRRNEPPAAQAGQGGSAAGGEDDEGEAAPAAPVTAAPPALPAVPVASSSSAVVPVAPPAQAAPVVSQTEEKAESSKAGEETPKVSATPPVPPVDSKPEDSSVMEVDDAPALVPPSAPVAADASEPAPTPATESAAMEVVEGGAAAVSTGEDQAATGVPAQPTNTAEGSSELSAAAATTESAPADVAAVAAPQDDRVLPDLRAAIAATSNPAIECRTKAIELLHVVTGELVRVFPSGKDAASFFNVAQSSISICLHNTKPEFLGFRWRHYVGPAINCKIFPLPTIK